MQTLYRVTNTSDIPLIKTWNKHLLSSEERQNYETYKQSEEYTGESTEEKSARIRIPEAIKSRPFFQDLQRDVMAKRYEPKNDGTHEVVSEFRWCLPPDYKKLEDQDIYRLREIAQNFGIRITEYDDESEIITKMKSEWGKDNTTIMNEEQVNESGLRQLEIKEIKQKLEPGELKQRVILSGFLRIEKHFGGDAKPKTKSKTNTKTKATKDDKDPSEFERVKKIFSDSGFTWKIGMSTKDMKDLLSSNGIDV